MRYQLQRWGWQALDLVFPPVCGGCGQSGQRWCAKCQASVKRLQPPLCDRCGQTIKNSGLCERCQQASPSFVKTRSWAEFSGPLREAVHSYKYQRNLGMAEIFANCLSAYLLELGWSVALIVPVPLGKERHHQRGYNQAALMAHWLALSAQIPYNDRSLQRVRETQSQVGLSTRERKQNVFGAFKVHGNGVLGKDILLVDDVMTSGATLNACADALLAAGAHQVFGLTLARAVLPAS
ncbi:MAG: ComF family protein [Anaerolineales bacterium]|nr:ComF family protein [Anaerolineales bacterium]